jgi:hypothetical protein
MKTIMAERDWGRWAAVVLKVEMQRRRFGFRDLAERLALLSVQENERNLTNKINRGTFSAAFFLQCLSAIGGKSLRFEDE